MIKDEQEVRRNDFTRRTPRRNACHAMGNAKAEKLIEIKKNWGGEGEAGFHSHCYASFINRHMNKPVLRKSILPEEEKNSTTLPIVKYSLQFYSLTHSVPITYSPKKSLFVHRYIITSYIMYERRLLWCIVKETKIYGASVEEKNCLMRKSQAFSMIKAWLFFIDLNFFTWLKVSVLLFI